MADEKQLLQLDAELPEPYYRELQAYAQEHGLSLEEAIVHLAHGQLQMRALGRRLGVEGFDRAPQ